MGAMMRPKTFVETSQVQKQSRDVYQCLRAIVIRWKHVVLRDSLQCFMVKARILYHTRVGYFNFGLSETSHRCQ